MSASVEKCIKNITLAIECQVDCKRETRDQLEC